MSEQNGRGNDFVIGAIVGGVVGAITALLLAPKSGKELRADLADKSCRVAEKTQEIASTVSNKTQELAGNVSVKTQELAKQVSGHADEWAHKAKEVIDTVASEVKAWKETRQEAAVSNEETEEPMPADAAVLPTNELK